jgi:hypothetical protein
MRAILLSVAVLATLPVCAATEASTNVVLSPSATRSYQIRNSEFGDLLRPRNASGANGTPMVLYPEQQWKCMTWKLQPGSDSAFVVQNHFTSKTFTTVTNQDRLMIAQEPLGSDPARRTQWKFTALEDGTYQITDPRTGQALTAVKNQNGGVEVIAAPWTAAAGQKWRLTEIDPSKLTM